jgi:hypothetical protein
MLNQHHPDDERLSALASRDDDAAADAALTSHVHACARCADLVSELGVLRTSLADLPDLRPSRPLQLLPPVADDRSATGAGGWIRRLFAPALTAGAAIAMVGLIGTAAPALDGVAGGGGIFQDVGTRLSGGDSAAEELAPEAAESMDVAVPADGYERGDADSGAAEPSDAALGAAGGEGTTDPDASQGGVSRLETFDGQLPAERSPWPMVLFTGVALMVAAALLRWILVPRAG